MTLLTFKNQELTTFVAARDLSSVVQDIINGESVPPADAAGIDSAESFYYAANNLIITLDEGLPTNWFFAGPEIKAFGYWKVAEGPVYKAFRLNPEVVVFTPGRITLKINSSDQRVVEEYFTNYGITKPDFGLFSVVINFRREGSSERIPKAYVLKYTHIPLFSSAVVNVPIPPVIEENTYRSPPFSFETFFVPSISSSYHYNFYENEEGDYQIYQTRDYRGYKLTDIPKYVKLRWSLQSFNYGEWFTENEQDNIYQFAAVLPESTSSAPTPTTPASGSIESIFFGTGLFGPVSIIQEPEDEDGLVFVMTTPGSRTEEAARNVFDGGRENINSEFFTPEGAIDISTVSPMNPVETLGLESNYIGFVVEKSRVEEDGTFTVVDLIAIAGRNRNEFIDWKIAYGEVYRYRVRSVFRYVDRKNSLSLYQDSDTSITKQQAIDYIDESFVANRKTYYFDGVFSEATEIQTTEDVRPNPPDNVRIFPKSRDKSILLTWSQKNQNRDVIGFNVYRRTEDSFFQRMNLEIIDIRNNLYVDFDIVEETEYIYAIEAIDVHGNFSPLSAQYLTKIKEVTSNELFCEIPQKFYENEGLEIGEQTPKPKQNLLVCKNKIDISINPLFQTVDLVDVFVVRATSLDTGQKKEINLNFKSTTIYHVAPYIPAEEPDGVNFILTEEGFLSTITSIFGNE